MKETDPHRNVMGVGLGPKMKDGVSTGRESVRFYVERKIKPESSIPEDHLLPRKIGAMETDVVAVGRLRCAAMEAGGVAQPHIVRPGTSCGVRFGRCGDGATGTIAAIVTRNGKQFILSSAHVLARANGFLRGAPILCPGPVDLPLVANEHGHGHTDSGSASLAQQADFERARLDSFVSLSLDGSNKMDAGIAEVSAPFEAIIPGVGGLTQGKPVTAHVGMRVEKLGIATGLTGGTVVDIDFDGRVDFPLGPLQFENELLIEGDNASAFAWEGDSGALVFTRQQRSGGVLPVAIVVGFSLPEATDEPPASFCLATDLSLVLDALGVELMTA